MEAVTRPKETGTQNFSKTCPLFDTCFYLLTVDEEHEYRTCKGGSSKYRGCRAYHD